MLLHPGTSHGRMPPCTTRIHHPADGRDRNRTSTWRLRDHDGAHRSGLVTHEHGVVGLHHGSHAGGKLRMSLRRQLHVAGRLRRRPRVDLSQDRLTGGCQDVVR